MLRTLIHRKISLLIFSVVTFSLAHAWELGENRKVDTSVIGGKRIRKEVELVTPYVGPYQLLPNSSDGNAQYDDYFKKRLFSTEIELENSPLNRYYVQDLQYPVSQKAENAKGYTLNRGVRLIPIKSGSDECRIPSAPLNIRQRYPQVVAEFFDHWGISPNARTMDCWYVRDLLVRVRTYQVANNDQPLLYEVGDEEEEDRAILAILNPNKEPSVGTGHVETMGSLLAYGKDEKKLPLHMIVPHTTASEFYYNDLGDLASSHAKPQTSIHHVSGFYRFEGDSQDSRRSMLSEGEPTNLLMVFSRKGANNRATTPEAIEGAQLNLALWFMLYYENPEGYAFSEDYNFDDAYITNLEELFEMARGWLNRSYIREDFNKLHAARIVKRLDKLMLPVNKLLNEKDTFTKEDVEDANNNIWSIRSIVAMLYGPEEVQKLEAAQETIWQIMDKVYETENIRELRLSPEENTKVLALLNLLKGYQTGASSAAKNVAYYDLLQSDPTLAEYCNEGVKDQVDKGLNVPLARKWLYKIYPKADADVMFDTAEKKICHIQILRENKRLTEEQQALIKTNPCAVMSQVLPTGILLRDREATIEKMTPLFAAGDTIKNLESFNEANPLVPRRNSEGAPVDVAANQDRDRDIRLIGNGLLYAPQTTLDIINSFSNVYVPFHKAGASASAVVAMGFLKEHLRRTGIDSEIYVSYTSKILNELYAAEAKIFKTQFAALPADQQAGAWAKYVAGVETFYSSVLPGIIDNALAESDEEGEDPFEENDGIIAQPRELPRDTPEVTGAQLAEQLYTSGIKAAIESATPYSGPEVMALGGPEQFSFGAYKATTQKVSVIVEEANHKYSTVPANAFEAMAQGTKRVKFYYQPGINALLTMGLVKVNPNALIVNVGTAISQDKIVMPAEGDTQAIDRVNAQVTADGKLMFEKIVKPFVEGEASAAELKKYRDGLYPNSIVGRPW